MLIIYGGMVNLKCFSGVAVLFSGWMASPRIPSQLEYRLKLLKDAHGELAEWLVNCASELVSRYRCSTWSFSMMDMLQ